MTVSLRNTSGQPLHLGSRDGRLVDVDEVVRVDGALAKDGPADAYVVGSGDEARAYPKSLWTTTGGPAARSATEEIGRAHV